MDSKPFFILSLTDWKKACFKLITFALIIKKLFTNEWPCRLLSIQPRLRFAGQWYRRLWRRNREDKYTELGHDRRLFNPNCGPIKFSTDEIFNRLNYLTSQESVHQFIKRYWSVCKRRNWQSLVFILIGRSSPKCPGLRVRTVRNQDN